MLLRFIIALVIFATPLMTSAADVSPKSRQTKDGDTHVITILSIIPAQGEPETSVTLSGSGFTSGTTAFLGTTSTKTEVQGPRLLSFTIPPLSPGLYALFLKDTDGTISRTYNFSILPPKPVIYSISPDTIQACASDKERHVLISGQNFLERSQAIFDGAAIKGTFISRESFSFTVPPVASGLHQVQMKNPGDVFSGAQGLLIDSRPEIDSVTTADEAVTFYNLVIGGRNFQQDSILMVTEEKSLDQYGNPQSDENVKRLRNGASIPPERDRIVYVNCGKILYQRFPYSTVLKSFKVQVINPSGEESSIVQVSAP